MFRAEANREEHEEVPSEEGEQPDKARGLQLLYPMHENLPSWVPSTQRRPGKGYRQVLHGRMASVLGTSPKAPPAGTWTARR